MIYDKICLMVPTYQRIERITTFLNSAIETAHDVNNLCFCFCVNKQDIQTREYLHKYDFPHDDWVSVLESTKQPNLSLYFNLMYENTKWKNAVVTELGDDMIFMTKDWDAIILEEINKKNGIVIVYCNDDYIAHDKCAVNLFTTRELVTKTQKPFMCPLFHADMIDVIWTMVGKITDILTYFPDVIIKHNHSTRFEKEYWDATYQRLAPVQKAVRGITEQKTAVSYATLVAKNLIEAGVGSWNVLQ